MDKFIPSRLKTIYIYIIYILYVLYIYVYVYVYIYFIYIDIYNGFLGFLSPAF